MISTRSDLKNSLICSLITTAALLLAWPFANLPFNDDWTWSFTVWKLLTTGHLVYNGWSSPPVIAQAYWGLAWVKLFGFSFTILRISSLPMAFGAVTFTYLLARRANLTHGMSTFVALMLGLSPLYMPLECTFMTDVPGVFFMVLSMYAMLRGFESRSRRSSIAWLMFGAISALIGGSSRQVVWIVPLIVLPQFAWLRRKDFAFAIGAVSGWLIVFGGAIILQHWYAQQPYALPDPPAVSYLHALVKYPKQFSKGMIDLILTAAIALLPATIGAFRPRWGTVETLAAILFLPMLFLLRHHTSEPWMGNIVTSHGVLGGIELFSYSPLFFGEHFRRGLSLVVIGSLALLIACGIQWVIQNRRDVMKKSIEFFLAPQGQGVAISSLVLLSLALFGLEITRVISQVAYDRHLLPFIPFLAIPLLFALQRRGLSRMPIWSWVLLGAYGIYALASTQDVNSLARARLVAIQRLEQSGIAANQIEGGFEHNYLTQVQAQGYVNDPRIRNPAEAYDKSKGPTPGLRILYKLEFNVTPVTAPTSLGTVSYFSLLPPFQRTIHIDRFTDAWWLDQKKAATRPAERSLLPKVLLDQFKPR